MTTKLTASEIIKIIKQAKRLGVSHFQLGELKLRFGDAAQIVKANPENEISAREEHENEIKSEQLENLRLSDPFTYEQMMCNDLDEKETPFGT